MSVIIKPEECRRNLKQQKKKKSTQDELRLEQTAVVDLLGLEEAGLGRGPSILLLPPSVPAVSPLPAHPCPFRGSRIPSVAPRRGRSRCTLTSADEGRGPRKKEKAESIERKEGREKKEVREKKRKQETPHTGGIRGEDETKDAAIFVDDIVARRKEFPSEH